MSDAIPSEAAPTPTKPTGKGINAWLSNRVAAGPTTPPGTIELELDLLDQNPEDSRQAIDPLAVDDLAASIAQYELLQPITVAKRPDNPGRYFIIAGRTRTLAYRQLRDGAKDETERARWRKIPAHDRGPTAIDQLAELSLAENLQRTDLRPMETATAVAKLQAAKSLTVEALAEKLNIDETKTKRYLQLARAPDTVRDALGRGLMVTVEEDPETGKPVRAHRHLDMGHALLVLRAYNHWLKAKPKKAAELTRDLTERVLSEQWTNQRLTTYVRTLLSGPAHDHAGPDEAPLAEGDGTATTAAPKRRLYDDASGKLVVHCSRLDAASDAEKAALRGVLEALIAQL